MIKRIKYSKVYGKKCFNTLFVIAKKSLVNLVNLKNMHDITNDELIKRHYVNMAYISIKIAEPAFLVIFMFDDHPLYPVEYAAYRWALTIKEKIDTTLVEAKFIDEDDDLLEDSEE